MLGLSLAVTHQHQPEQKSYVLIKLLLCVAQIMGTSAIISFLHLPSRKGDKSSEVVVQLSMWRDNNNNNINKSVTHAVLSFHGMYFVNVQLHILVSLRVFSWGTLHQLFSLLVADWNLGTMVCMNRVSENRWWPWAKHHRYLNLFCSQQRRAQNGTEVKNTTATTSSALRGTEVKSKLP